MESWLNNHPMYKSQNTTGPTVLRQALPLHHYHSRSVVRSERFLTDLRSMQFSHRSSASQPWDFERKSATQASPAAKEKTQIVNSMGQHSFLHNRQKSPSYTKLTNWFKCKAHAFPRPHHISSPAAISCPPAVSVKRMLHLMQASDYAVFQVHQAASMQIPEQAELSRMMFKE